MPSVVDIYLVMSPVTWVQTTVSAWTQHKQKVFSGTLPCYRLTFCCAYFGGKKKTKQINRLSGLCGN